MLELRTDSGVSRYWRLPALVTGITLIAGSTVVRVTAERPKQPHALRRLRMRSVERPQRPGRAGGMMLVAAGVDALVPDGRALEKGSPEARAVPMQWPVRGPISSPFGWRRSPYGNEREWHPGIDISAAYGTAVRATADGVVVFSGRARGYGVVVAVDHGTTITRYAHLSQAGVHTGQEVRRGDRLGAVGRTGRATAPHLHFEVRLAGEAVDPTCLMNGPVAATASADAEPSPGCALVRRWLASRSLPPQHAHGPANEDVMSGPGQPLSLNLGSWGQPPMDLE